MDTNYFKYNLIFYTKIEHYFVQIFLHPLVWILGTVLIATIKGVLVFGNTTFLFLLVVYWTISGRYFPILYPLFIIAGYDTQKEQTTLSAGFLKNHAAGILRSIIEFDNSYIITIMTKYGKKSIDIPIDYLPENMLNLIKETLLNMSLSNFDKIDTEFKKNGYNTYLKKDKKHFQYYNLYIKNGFTYMKLKLSILSLSMLLCYYIGFHLMK